MNLYLGLNPKPLLPIAGSFRIEIAYSKSSKAALVYKKCQHSCLSQVTQHGACLGLGLAGLGSGDDELFEDLKNVLYLDSAVAGEAAGLALGLLHVGTATEKAAEMLAYAHDTQHEKVGLLFSFGHNGQHHVGLSLSKTKDVPYHYSVGASRVYQRFTLFPVVSMT